MSFLQFFLRDIASEYSTKRKKYSREVSSAATYVIAAAESTFFAAFFSSSVTSTPVSASIFRAREDAFSSTGSVTRLNTVESAYRQMATNTIAFPTAVYVSAQVSTMPTITSGKAR